MKTKIATTVKIESLLYDELKILGIRNKITLQSLIEKTVYRYVNDPLFRESINSFNIPIISDVSTETILILSSSLSE